MRVRRGLTLIEVLLSVVLLAVLAATVAPYLAARPKNSDVAEYSAFVREVRIALAGFEHSRSGPPSLEEVRLSLHAIGAQCRAGSEADPVLSGRWIVIERGPQRVFYWIHDPETGGNE